MLEDCNVQLGEVPYLASGLAAGSWVDLEHACASGSGWCSLCWRDGGEEGGEEPLVRLTLLLLLGQGLEMTRQSWSTIVGQSRAFAADVRDVRDASESNMVLDDLYNGIPRKSPSTRKTMQRPGAFVVCHFRSLYSLCHKAQVRITSATG